MPGFYEVSNNVFVACTGAQPVESNAALSIPYPYDLDDPNQIPSIVAAGAGVGKLAFAAMKRLQGRRVVLTGASRGIGFETAKLFSAEGAEVIGVARIGADCCEELERTLPGFQKLAGNITDPAPRRAWRRREGALGRASISLINNAAIQEWNKGFREEPVEALERTGRRTCSLRTTSRARPPAPLARRQGVSSHQREPGRREARRHQERRDDARVSPHHVLR